MEYDNYDHAKDPTKLPSIHNFRFDLAKTIATGEPFIVGEKYKMLSKLEWDATSEIYTGVSLDGQEDVVLKVEHIRDPTPLLHHEYLVYQNLKEGSTAPNRFIPEVKWYGQVNDYNILVLEQLGPSVHDLFYFTEDEFTLKTVLTLADQMISRVEWLHSKGFIHRDIRPTNFLMGMNPGDKTNVYIMDFGVSRQYHQKGTGEHLPFRRDRSVCGTPRFTSLNAHRGYELSRRDDMESLGYTFIYLLRGSLPWEGIRTATFDEKMEQILQVKSMITIEQLCHGQPDEFVTYFHHVRNLYFEETPDYAFLRLLFRKLYSRTFDPPTYDFQYDWIDSNVLAERNKVWRERCHEERIAKEKKLLELYGTKEDKEKALGSSETKKSQPKKTKIIPTRKEIRDGRTVWVIDTKAIIETAKEMCGKEFAKPEVKDVGTQPDSLENFFLPLLQGYHSDDSLDWNLGKSLGRIDLTKSKKSSKRKSKSKTNSKAKSKGASGRSKSRARREMEINEVVERLHNPSKKSSKSKKKK